MNCNPSALLIDTNVWVDNYDPSRAGNAAARQLLDYAVSHGIALLFAPTSVKDVYYLIAASLKIQERAATGSVDENAAQAINQIAWGCVDNMAELGTLVGFDESDFLFARKLKPVHGDFENDMVLAACERSHADYLVTGDAKLRRNAPVPALSPAKMLELLKSFDPT